VAHTLVSPCPSYYLRTCDIIGVAAHPLLQTKPLLNAAKKLTSQGSACRKCLVRFEFCAFCRKKAHAAKDIALSDLNFATQLLLRLNRRSGNNLFAAQQLLRDIALFAL